MTIISVDLAYKRYSDIGVVAWLRLMKRSMSR